MPEPTHDVLIGHTSDGIQEFDNPMPMWWLGIFWVTIIFGVVFTPYLALTGWTQVKQYDAELAAAEAEYAPKIAAQKEAAAARRAEAASQGGAPSAADIEAGRALFVTNCVACHAADGTGGIGPDLTDAEWIHGGTLDQITTTVNEGVLAKGMIAWGPILGDDKVAQVTAYVHSLGGGQ